MSVGDLTLVVVAKDQAGLRGFHLAHVEAADLILVANTAGIPLSAIGNHYLRNARTPLFGLVHADVIFGSESLEVFCREAAAGKVCGVVGVNPLLPYPQSYVWAIKIPKTAPVSTVDSASVFFRRDLGLSFDEKTFDSYRLHVEDVCIQAAQHGIPVVVPAARAWHDSHEVTGRAWLEQYRMY